MQGAREIHVVPTRVKGERGKREREEALQWARDYGEYHAPYAVPDV